MAMTMVTGESSEKKGYLPGLVICDIAIENGTVSSLIYLLKMGDFP
jgi:hypothetical protein